MSGAPLRMSGRPATRRRQRGVALIIMMLVVVLGVSWMIVSALSTWLNPAAANPSANGKVLGEARDALLGYVAKEVMDASEQNPGRLPCPEALGYVGTANEGIAAGSCTLPAVGRLPWRTLGLDKLVDASGEPLWYVVSPGWAYTSGMLHINFDTTGQLSLQDAQGNTVASNLVALIIAPGPPLSVQASANCAAVNQTRSLSSLPPPANWYQNYLECQNGKYPSTGTFAIAGPQGSFNDQVVQITAADVMRVIEGPIAQRIQRDIVPAIAAAGATMGTLRLPAPSPVPSIFPMAQPWADPTTIANPFGAANTYGGLLPLARSRKACDPATDAACDPILKSEPCVPGNDAQCDLSTAVNWPIGSTGPSTRNTGGNTWTVTWKNGPQTVQVITVDQAPDDTTSMKISKVDCASSSSTQVSCTLTYGWKCSPVWRRFWNLCSIQPWVTVQATADNVGLGFRILNAAELGSMYRASGTGNAIALASDGSASITTEWQLPATPSDCNDDKCQTATVNVPSLYITDNVGFQSQLRDLPTSGSDLRWFLNDDWEDWTYYAVSQRYAPGGAGNCTGSTPPCLTVNNYTPPPNNDKQALLVFSGRALAGQTQPSSDPTQYFESPNATGSTFEMRSAVTSTFNDRVLVISP